MSTPTSPTNYWDQPQPAFQPPQLPAPKKSHTARKVWLICLGAIGVLVLILVVIVASSGNGTSSGPVLTPGSATVDQICQTQVGSGIQNSITGQNTNQTIVSATDGSVISNLNASGNEVVSCTFTESTGEVFGATVTLFANGSTSWYAG